MPRGFFGTRADLFMDVTIVLLTALPFVMLAAFRLARHRRLTAHRTLQIALLATVLVVLVLFELDIRLSGGTQAFVAQSRLGPIALPLLRIHVAIATITFLSWLALILASLKRFRRVLPGPFTPRHRMWGKLTFVGVCLLSSTGAALYACVYLA
jgi:putative membrane protein